MSLMSEERWAQTIADLTALGDVTGEVTPDQVFTNDYLSKDVITPKLSDLPAAPPGSYIGQ